MIEVRVEFDSEEVRKRLAALRARMPSVDALILKRLAETAIRIMQEEHLNAPPGPSEKQLHSVTGLLSSSIAYVMVEGGRAVDVFSKVIYAPVHEFGATITAKRAPMLVFEVEGRVVRVKSVKIPARPYMQPSIQKLFDRGEATRLAELTMQQAINAEGLGA